MNKNDLEEMDYWEAWKSSKDLPTPLLEKLKESISAEIFKRNGIETLKRTLQQIDDLNMLMKNAEPARLEQYTRIKDQLTHNKTILNKLLEVTK